MTGDLLGERLGEFYFSGDLLLLGYLEGEGDRGEGDRL